jgi:hypothetical protein
MESSEGIGINDIIIGSGMLLNRRHTYEELEVKYRNSVKILYSGEAEWIHKRRYLLVRLKRFMMKYVRE